MTSLLSAVDQQSLWAAGLGRAAQACMLRASPVATGWCVAPSAQTSLWASSLSCTRAAGASRSVTTSW